MSVLRICIDLFRFISTFIDLPRVSWILIDFNGFCMDLGGFHGFQGSEVCQPLPAAAGLKGRAAGPIETLDASGLESWRPGGLEAWRLGKA